MSGPRSGDTVPADNSIYETLDDWWDPTGSVAGLHAMNPARAGYFRRVLENRWGLHLAGRRILDLGCGGGLLTEELLRVTGTRPVGVDLAHGALRCALAHGRRSGLQPSYLRALAEELPFPDEQFDAVVCCDFLEHVSSLGAVLSECARVLRAGGLFLYDTINRTWLTRVIHIGVVQQWRKLVPPETHDWRQFVKPGELEAALRAVEFRHVETRGLQPAHPLRFALHLLVHRPGKDRMPTFRIGGWTAGSYVGYAVKGSGAKIPGLRFSSRLE